MALSRLSRRRLVALYLLVSLLPLIALSYLAVAITTNAVANRANQSLSLSASLGALYIGEQVQSLEEIVNSFAHEPNFVAALADGDPAHYDHRVIDATLKQLSRVRPGIAGALLVTTEGSLTDQFPFQVNLGTKPGFAASDWIQVVRRSMASYVSPMYTSGASGSPLVTGVAAPVNEVAGDGTSGPLLGIVAVEYSISDVDAFTQRFATAEGLSVTVADQRGALVAGPRSLNEPASAADADRGAITAARQGYAGSIQTSGPDAKLIAYAPIPSMGWAVTAEIAASDAFADVDRLRITVIAFAIPLGLVLILGAWLLNRTLGFWQRAEAEVRRLAAIDALTGIYNRRSWDEHLARELARSRRERRPLSVAMIDLDHFKRFNDRNGHPAGDRLLAEAATAWRSAIRTTDILARYGGEEFAAALPDCPIDQAVGIMDRLRTVVPMDQTFSAGVACWDGAESGAALMARADRALYEAKDQGRNRVIVADTQAAAAA
jgi:diguanylate cyclase (GGDEF)-like protein